MGSRRYISGLGLFSKVGESTKFKGSVKADFVKNSALRAFGAFQKS
jgi:hypothetical protein